MDDSGSLFDVVGDIAGSVGGELAKIGKSAVGQISGKPTDSKSPVNPSDITKSADSQSEIKKAGQAIGAQITGGGGAQTDAEVAAMAQKDKEFSQAGVDQVRVKVKQIYEEYAAKKAREQRQQEAAREQQEERKKLEVEQLKKQERKSPVSPAIDKSRAEIKNYGAE